MPVTGSGGQLRASSRARPDSSAVIWSRRWSPAGDRVRCLVRPTSDRRWLDRPGSRRRQAVDDVGVTAKAVAGVDVCLPPRGGYLGRAPRRLRPHQPRRRRPPPRLRLPRGRRPARLVFCSSLAAGGPARAGRPLTEADPPAPDRPVRRVEGSGRAGDAGGSHACGDRPALRRCTGRATAMSSRRFAWRRVVSRSGPARAGSSSRWCTWRTSCAD